MSTDSELRADARSSAGPSRRAAGLPAPVERTEWTDIPFADRMATVEFRIAERPHIVVDSGRCEGCATQACVTACPANLFVPTADGRILFNYEQCFECGTCYLACNTEGAIQWNYPVGGFGVVLRRS
jgi:ferredoxin like protein